ncbi:O-acyltransferase WSD1-like isoform X1 [Carica papaya]|uniref:O-acyltransferase WSD1-like isoform X1 n=2 Tax=Carica papaya TaxID=3649 RepID=UPI000B8CC32A|nr:O-acyltransferase WSD1-like isoform X1 [Carica papaya]
MLTVATTGGDLSSGEEAPASPAARLFNVPGLKCYIIAVMGCKTRIDPGVVIEGLKHTLIKHPRFSSILVGEKNNKRRLRWIKTKVKVEDHVIVPDINPEMESPEKFIEDYTSNLTKDPMDFSKPLWELHLLNVKTSDADAVGIFKIHHSVGDGMSLISLLLACTRKTSDPDSLPTVPEQRKQSTNSSWKRFWWVFMAIWSGLVVMVNSVVDILVFAATMSFLKDTKNPLKGDGGDNSVRVFIYRTISLDDIKLVKNFMNVTVNDVILGVTQAGLSKYIYRKYGENKRGDKMTEIPKRMRVRAAVMANIREVPGIQVLANMMAKGSKAIWGNCIGYILIPFTIALQKDPLDYIRTAKSIVDRKKLSCEAILSFQTAKLILKLFGSKVAAGMTKRIVSNTTMTFSNIVGPLEEISFYGHPIAYLAPSVYGHPHALTLHFQSYINKMTFSVAVDPDVIPDPHQLCNDLEEALKIIKIAASEKSLIQPPLCQSVLYY